MQRSLASALLSTMAIALGASVAAQQPKTLQFEAATIKPGHLPSDPRMGESYAKGAGGQYQMVNMPLRQWVEMGLSVGDYALRAPSWIEASRFDLNAKLPADTPLSQIAMAEMMRSLLIDRFGLKWHEEQQTVAGYELTVDKKVLIQPASLLERMRGSGSSSGPTIIQGTNLPLSRLVEALAKVLGKPVVDATHLAGVFSYKVMWRPEDEAVLAELKANGKQNGIDVDTLPDSVFTALKEQLGLRLQPAKVLSKVTVIDNINRQPTAN